MAGQGAISRVEFESPGVSLPMISITLWEASSGMLRRKYSNHYS